MLARSNSMCIVCFQIQPHRVALQCLNSSSIYACVISLSSVIQKHSMFQATRQLSHADIPTRLMHDLEMAWQLDIFDFDVKQSNLQTTYSYVKNITLSLLATNTNRLPRHCN